MVPGSLSSQVWAVCDSRARECFKYTIDFMKPIGTKVYSHDRSVTKSIHASQAAHMTIWESRCGGRASGTAATAEGVHKQLVIDTDSVYAEVLGRQME